MSIFLKNKGWILEIDLKGGRIINLVKDNQRILGTYERIDKKLGNTHICVPNFAAEGVEKYGFVFHGPFRNGEWIVVNQDKNRIEISCEIENLLVNQIFEIEEEFSQKVRVKNTGNGKKRVHLAIHNYWDTENEWNEIILNKDNIHRVLLIIQK